MGFYSTNSHFGQHFFYVFYNNFFLKFIINFFFKKTNRIKFQIIDDRIWFSVSNFVTKIK
jgi:hypothetical protein